MKTVLVGITGGLGEGKDEVCIGIRRVEPEAQRFAFADRLKQEVCEHLSITLAQLEEQKRSKTDGTMRKLLQNWGMAKREDDPDYWLRYLQAKIKSSGVRYALITDARLPNELEWVQQNGFLLRVERPGFASDDQHITEQAWRATTPLWTFYNNAGKSELHEDVGSAWPILKQATSEIGGY